MFLGLGGHSVPSEPPAPTDLHMMRLSAPMSLRRFPGGQDHREGFVDTSCRLVSTTGYPSGPNEPVWGSIGANEINV